MEKPRRDKIREVESIINWIQKEEDNLKKTVEKLRENRLRLERWVREEKKSSVSLVLVLGCTTPDTSNISLNNTGQAAKELYFELKKKNDVIVIATGFQPARSDETEAKRIRRYLVNEGLPSQDILLEEKATTTVTMATLCRPIIGEIQQQFRLSQLHVITRTFQLLRARFVFDNAYKTCNRRVKETFPILYHGVEDNLSDHYRERLLERENVGIERLKERRDVLFNKLVEDFWGVQ